MTDESIVRVRQDLAIHHLLALPALNYTVQAIEKVILGQILVMPTLLAVLGYVAT